MAEDYTKTVRIQRPSKVAPDERGRNVWVGRVEEVELELVSTTALERILKSGDGGQRAEIRKLADGRKDGILARDLATGVFQILTRAELKRARDTSAPPVPAPKAELSLVSTQILRKTLQPDKGKDKDKDKGGGFDPYNRG